MVDMFEEDFDSNDEFQQNLNDYAKSKSPQNTPSPSQIKPSISMTTAMNLSPLSSPVTVKVEKVTLEDISPPIEEIIPDKANQPSYLFTAEQLDMWLGSNSNMEPVKIEERSKKPESPVKKATKPIFDDDDDEGPNPLVAHVSGDSEDSEEPSPSVEGSTSGSNMGFTLIPPLEKKYIPSSVSL